MEPSTPSEQVDPGLKEALYDRYRLRGVLGKGGMGTVYLADHATLPRKCAVKMLDGRDRTPTTAARFLREAKATSCIVHPNVIQISDYGEAKDGTAFFVMEHLEGEDLGRTLWKEGPMPWARVKAIMVQVCAALQAAHDQGVTHRDLKPDNCFRIEADGTKDFIKVFDFGIAKVSEAPGEKPLTKVGFVCGTPEYMSPEQALGNKVDHRTDIYAAGVMMYELLCGKAPFEGDPPTVLEQQINATAPPLRERNPQIELDIPPGVDAIVTRALDKRPRKRFQTMRELEWAIRAADGESVPEVAPTTPTTADSLSPPSGAPAARRIEPVWVLLGVGMMVVPAVVFLALLMRQAPADPPLARATARAEPAPQPQMVPTPVVTAPALTKGERVHIEVTTNVEARVLDALDGAIYGKSNGGPLVFERSDEPLKLRLTAEGHRDHTVEIVPNRDRGYDFVLEAGDAGAGATAAKSARPEAGSDPNQSAGAEQKAPAEAPDMDFPESELKNPFIKP